MVVLWPASLIGLWFGNWLDVVEPRRGGVEPRFELRSVRGTGEMADAMCARGRGEDRGGVLYSELGRAAVGRRGNGVLRWQLACAPEEARGRERQR